MAEVVAQITSAWQLQLCLARLSKIYQDRTVLLLAATSLLGDQMAYRTHNKLREMQAMSVEVGEEVREMMETVDLADIEAIHPRTEHQGHQPGHARTKLCMAEMEQESDPGPTTHKLRETCEEAVDKRRRTFVVGQVLRGETPVLKNRQGTREDQAGRRGSIEIGEESLSRERQVIGEMGEIEETAVGAEESGEEVAMKAKGSEASPTIKGHGDDMRAAEYS